MFYRVGIFIEIEAKNALIGSGYRSGIFKNRIGLKIRDTLYFVSGNPALAF
jgi:hypothetical protein